MDKLSLIKAELKTRSEKLDNESKLFKDDYETGYEQGYGDCLEELLDFINKLEE